MESSIIYSEFKTFGSLLFYAQENYDRKKPQHQQAKNCIEK